MKILIRNGHVVDPSQDLDGAFDVLINGSHIEKLAPAGTIPLSEKDANVRVIDATGKYVLPGLVDMHVHLRQPGFEHKETIRTGTHAAVRGGITTVCCMPNTSPVNDNAGITEYIIDKAQNQGLCTVYPIGSITKGQLGEELAEMGMMIEQGCVGFSDDGRPVASSIMMRRALEYSRTFDTCIISHAEDPELSKGGVMNEGRVSINLGLQGIPRAAEETMIFRDIALCELTGGKLHIAHISTEGSVRIIREAKSRGVNVTAETCPHYFTVTEDECEGFNTDAKVNPPLRTEADVAAIRHGLEDGTIDVIATDHAPHHRNEKSLEFNVAPPGISGLETSLSLALGLVRDGLLDMKGLVKCMALRPAKILKLNKGTLRHGADADVVIVDPELEYTIDSNTFFSKGKNTPFNGMKVKGRAVVTIARAEVFQWETH